MVVSATASCSKASLVKSIVSYLKFSEFSSTCFWHSLSILKCLAWHGRITVYAAAPHWECTLLYIHLPLSCLTWGPHSFHLPLGGSSWAPQSELLFHPAVLTLTFVLDPNPVFTLGSCSHSKWLHLGGPTTIPITLHFGTSFPCMVLMSASFSSIASTTSQCIPLSKCLLYSPSSYSDFPSPTPFALQEWPLAPPPFLYPYAFWIYNQSWILSWATDIHLWIPTRHLYLDI